MDRETKRLVEEFRRSEAGPIENNLIDELVVGELDRQEFLRRASVFGLGAGTVGLLLRYLGEADLAFGAPMPAAKVGGTLRIGSVAYNSKLEPYGLQGGGLARPRWDSRRIPHLDEQQVRGEAVAGDELEAQRRPHGVDLPDPQRREVPQRQDPERRRRRREHQAVPQRQGRPRVLGGAAAEHDRPRGRRQDGAVHGAVPVQAPNNAFPFLVSQTTYQAIIQPAAIAAKPDTWVSSGMIGTGPFRLKSQNKQRAELVRNNNYWGGKPPLDGVVITFYTDPAPMVLALRAGQLDLVLQMSPQQARAFKNNSKYRVYIVAGLVAQHVRDAGRSRPVPRRPRASSGRAHAQPSGHHQPRPARRRRARERHAVLPGIRIHRPVDPPAEAEPRPREGALEGGGQGRPQVHDHDPQPVRRPGLCGRRSGRRVDRRASRSTWTS